MHKGDALNYIYYVVTGSMEILKGGMVVAILGMYSLFVYLFVCLFVITWNDES